MGCEDGRNVHGGGRGCEAQPATATVPRPGVSSEHMGMKQGDRKGLQKDGHQGLRPVDHVAGEERTLQQP